MTHPLIQEIDDFLARDDVRITATAFGLAVLNDGKFVSELRRGRRLWPDTEQKVREFIANFGKTEGAQNDQRQGAAA